MAPIRPAKSRLSSRPQPSASVTARPRSLDEPYANPRQQNKAPTKVHKRSVKHATLLSRLQRTAPGSKIVKRRRPSKKLVTDLGSLEDALPTTDGSNKRAIDDGDATGKIKHKSLKSRPGAMKRKEKLMTAERERFSKNLALMAAGSSRPATGADSSKLKNAHKSYTDGGVPVNDGGVGAPSASRAKWAAIRDHIGRTMETMDHTSSKG